MNGEFTRERVQLTNRSKQTERRADDEPAAELMLTSITPTLLYRRRFRCSRQTHLTNQLVCPDCVRVCLCATSSASERSWESRAPTTSEHIFRCACLFGSYAVCTNVISQIQANAKNCGICTCGICIADLILIKEVRFSMIWLRNRIASRLRIRTSNFRSIVEVLVRVLTRAFVCYEDVIIHM